MSNVFKGRKKSSETSSEVERNRRRKSKGVDEDRKAVGKSIGAAFLRLGRAKIIFRSVLKGLFVLAVTGAVIALGALAYRHATTSEHFACKKIAVTGAHRLSEEEVVRTAGVSLEQNIFGIDLEGAERMLTAHPWIARAKVERKLPGTVFIDISERRVKALVNLDYLYLVDDGGAVFKRWKQGDPVAAPVITGIAREQFQESDGEVETILREAIDLAERYRASGIEKNAPLAEIHREDDGGFSFTLGEEPVYVKLGKGPYRQKLARLSVLLAKIERDGRDPAVIYFDNEIRPDRITVKLKIDENMASITQAEDVVTAENKKRESKI